MRYILLASVLGIVLAIVWFGKPYNAQNSVNDWYSSHPAQVEDPTELIESSSSEPYNDIDYPTYIEPKTSSSVAQQPIIEEKKYRPAFVPHFHPSSSSSSQSSISSSAYSSISSSKSKYCSDNSYLSVYNTESEKAAAKRFHDRSCR